MSDALWLLLGTGQYLSPGVGRKNLGGGGGFTRNWAANRGGGYSLEDFVEGGGQKIHTVQLNLQYLLLTLVNMILQKT